MSTIEKTDTSTTSIPPHHHDEGLARPKFATRSKRHLTRWWWLYILIIGIILILVFVPLRYVRLPRVTQREVNNSYLEVIDQELSDATPTTFRLTQNATLFNPGKYRPRLNSFKAALFLEDSGPDIKPFGYVTIPSVVSEAQTEVYVNQIVDIVNVEQFTTFVKRVLGSEVFRVALRGRVGVKDHRHPTVTVDYNEVLTLTGLNRLVGFNITSFEVNRIAEPDGTNLIGIVSIPNPSKLTIQLGNVTLDLAVAGRSIGTALVPDLTLRPGTQSYAMRATTNLTLVAGLVQTQFQNAVLPLDIVGREVVNSAGEHLSHYEDAVRINPLKVNLNVGPALQSLRASS